MDNYCHLTITPISKDTKSPSYIDYNEQLSRVLNEEFQWCWDDSRYNKAKIGDYFAFYFHGMRVVIHKILDVKPPSARLPSWSKNVGQGDRNVVELSHPLLEITWIEWQLIGAPESKMGTYTTSDLSTERPRLYEYLKNSLGSKTNEKPNLKLIIEEDEADGIESIEIEEQKLLVRLEKIQRLKKINELQSEKNILLDSIKNIEKQIETLRDL
jgi:hypothetical protein